MAWPTAGVAGWSDSRRLGRPTSAGQSGATTSRARSADCRRARPLARSSGPRPPAARRAIPPSRFLVFITPLGSFRMPSDTEGHRHGCHATRMAGLALDVHQQDPSQNLVSSAGVPKSELGNELAVARLKSPDWLLAPVQDFCDLRPRDLGPGQGRAQAPRLWSWPFHIAQVA